MSEDVNVTERQEEPEAKEPRWIERVAPKDVDWGTLVVIPLLAVLSALIVGAVLIVISEGFDGDLLLEGVVLAILARQLPLAATWLECPCVLSPNAEQKHFGYIAKIKSYAAPVRSTSVTTLAIALA